MMRAAGRDGTKLFSKYNFALPAFRESGMECLADLFVEIK